MQGPRAAFLAFLTAASGCARSPAAPRAAAAVPVEIVPAASTPVEDRSEYVANMESRRSVGLMPEVTGRITRIEVKPGDLVCRGAVVVRLDASEARAVLRNSQALLRSALEALRFARTEYERDARLFASGSISAQQFDQSRTNLQTADSNAHAQAAQVRRQQVQLEYYDVTAPFEGIVGDIPVRVGQVVTESTTLTSIDQKRPLHVEISVPVERQADIRLDLRVRLRDPTGSVTESAAIDFVSPRVEPSTQTVLVKATIPNPTGVLRPDQFTRAEIVWRVADHLVLPTTAVTRLGGQTFAFVAEAKDGNVVARQRPVRLGDIVDNRYVVLEGIGPGDRIVVSGVQKLSDGVPIRPQS
jgi:RND family efflux transporter MFP subunit